MPSSRSIKRLAEQNAEKERSGVARLDARSDAGWNKVIDIEDEIREHPLVSILALGATFLIHIQVEDAEDDVLRTYRASLAAIRPRLVGAIAEDADRMLAQDEEAAHG